jgi:hypothetical protein
MVARKSSFKMKTPNKSGEWHNGRAVYRIVWIADVFPGRFVVDLGTKELYCSVDAEIVKSTTWVFVRDINFILV